LNVGDFLFNTVAVVTDKPQKLGKHL